ncbi:MAG: ATP-binding protein [Geitlerinemataceae cyanobacterium]
MEKFVSSTIQDLNAAIGNENPFEGRSRVSEPEIWGRECPDLLSLNAHATAAIDLEIEKVRSSRSPVRAIALLGESGMGKSHVLSRVRHLLQAQGNGLFIYINAQQFTDTSLIRQQFLYALVNSLKYPGSQGVMQWQELAIFPLEQALAISHPEATGLAAKKLIKKLNEQPLVKNQAWVNQVTEILFKSQPDIENPDLLRAIIWMLCNAQAPYARHWIAGRPIAKWKLDEVGLSDRSGENRESSAWEMTLQILQTISQYLPIVIAFDRLESNDLNEAVVKKEQVVASLIKRLSDNLRQIKSRYGVVLVSAMAPLTWYEKVQPFLGRFSSYISGQTEPVVLSPIDAHLFGEVLAQWLADFYVDRQLVPPTSVYPFDYSQFPALMRENLTLQETIEWCADNFKPVEVDPIEKVKQVFQELLEIDWHRELTTDCNILDALYFCFEILVGKTVTQFEVESVIRDIQPKQKNKNYIQFKISGIQKDRRSNIGISVLQHQNGSRVGALFRRLVSGDLFELTRTCLLRSYTHPISPNWKAYADFKIWKDRLQGRWVDANSEAIVPLLSLYQLYRQRDNYQLSQNQIFEFIDRSQLLENNPAIVAILRSPPEEIPDETTEIETCCPLIPPTPKPPSSKDSLCESPVYPSFQQDEL